MAEGNKTNSPNLPSNASSSPPNDDPEDNDAPEVEDDADEASSAATSSSNSPSLGGATANPPERGSKAAANHNGARSTRQPHNRGASNQSTSGCVNANHGRSHSRNSHRDHHHHHRERHHRERQRAPTSRSRERDAASNASHQGLEEPHEPEGDPEPESERAANSAPQGDNNPANSHPEPLAPSLGAAITSALAGAPSAPIPPPNHANVQYNWQAGKSSVRERLAFMFNNETLADVHFLVGKGGNVQRIPAHRFVLAIGSAVFDAMFNGGMATKSGEVELPDVEPAAFLAMLKFLYSDEVHIGPETVMTTLYTAKKYAVPALEQACVDFLKRNLCSENAFMLLTQARLFDESQLAALCLESIDKNTSEALSAEGFLDIDQETLAVVLERDTLGIRECKLFTSAVRWSEAECMRQSMAINATNQRQVMGRALQLIRFPLMTVEEFAMGSAQTGILTDREVVELFLHFTVNPKPSVHFLDTPRCCLTGKEQVVSRFCQIESRWGYSGTSDRIRFMVNRRIFVVGFGLYGSIHGPAEYSVNIQILHTDSGRVCGQNDTTFQCDGTNTTFRVMFKEPIEIQHNASFTACATLKGPDSYYGTKGLRKVTHESVTSGKVTFQFTYAAGNNNGTSVEDGQIPEIIFYT